MTEKKLLPVGFYDLLFDEAQRNHENVNRVLATFGAAGYRLIKTPLVEFEDNFSAAEMRNSFRTTDVISGKNLIFRNDITPQIARLLATRLGQEKLPLKLCYVGDVLCAKSEELYADRQQTQVGVELIGASDEEADLEIVKILLSALQELRSKNLLIEFSLPDFLEIFLAEIGEENSPELCEAVMRKNLSAIKKLAKENAEIISEIALCNNSLEGLMKKISAQKILHELKKAQKISQFLQKNFPAIEVRFDLFGDHKSAYHHGISFDVFSANFPYAIARGGRYKINNIDAVGATIYMNRLRKV